MFDCCLRSRKWASGAAVKQLQQSEQSTNALILLVYGRVDIQRSNCVSQSETILLTAVSYLRGEQNHQRALRPTESERGTARWTLRGHFMNYSDQGV